MSQLSKPNNLWRINRREFLKLSGLVAAGSLLSACQPKATATPVAATAVPATKAPEPKVGGTIDFLSWEGYDLPTCMTDWQESKGVVLSSSYIGDHAEIQAKLTTAQSAGFDLVTYYQGFADLYIIDLDILQPIDPSKVPNLKNTYELFQTGDFWVKDGKLWGVPFTWGAEGANYNADEIDPLESWWDLLEPEFKDRVGIVDEMYGSVIMGASAVGLSDKIPNLSQDELAQVKEFLLKVKAQARGIAPSFGDLTDMLVSGEIVVTFPGWAAVNVWAQERGVNVQHTIPKEGGFTFIDAYAIPKNADNVDATVEWINQALTPDVQACQAAYLAAGVVNPDAVPLLDEGTAALYEYDDMDAFFSKAPVYGSPPTESDDYATYDDWLNMWEEVKAE
jgi:spermidine/putrescine transport system substrate-binding protein